MNWRRALFKVWAALSIVWVVTMAIAADVNVTAPTAALYRARADEIAYEAAAHGPGNLGLDYVPPVPEAPSYWPYIVEAIIGPLGMLLVVASVLWVAKGITKHYERGG